MSTTIKIELRQQDLKKIHEICDSFNNEPLELINILHKTQEHFGYLPAEIQDAVADKLNISTAQVYGVVTFYSFFTMTPKGKHPISICMGTACYVRGAERILDEFKKELGLQVGQTTPDGKFSLSSLRCVGACGLAPVVIVGNKTYGRVAPDDVKAILKEYE
ncbi:MAG TPA: NADH-quinone oxidoreductase subunit NuoE [Bacteroidales bacterium]|jgi:NADH-quinone oxidoreductase subunit E/NADP-reducing hydrogenase subunit HndA|nr:NADH-quinone oxidoreductase subunit NuoE [Bacteroidales bacterium]MDI9533301.1 NADH-quinone oxidoreductase subunit NuoE [Bacteroidota bacterium]OPZ57649.1 MAG: NADP-reducing hydrogenase subunit HndA [Bacteroidetes bacterium ADurb.BinA012]MBK7731285.1 NADH-quinone oxidoreductase subunit NuoE [Bacteroidales bacterium]MBP7036679.1 NADH-quinone oxidoreductase subunit NuoE [Bacteroidales bacterium]